MWNNAAETIVGTTGELYIAPVGTALPTTPVAALNNAFVGLGYTDEDGVSFSEDPTVTDFNAWQSRQPIRRELTSQAISITAKLAQHNEINIPLALGGGVVTNPSAGVYKYTPPSAGDALDERSLVFDVQDGIYHYRYVFYRGNVSETVAIDYKRSTLAVLPITFRVLSPEEDPNGPPYAFYTDDPSFAVGS